MSFLREVQLDDEFSPFVAYRESFGFIPNLLRAQALLPRLIEAHAALETFALTEEKALSRVLKEEILLVLAAERRDVYCVTARSMILRSLALPEAKLVQFLSDFRSAGCPSTEVALIDFCLKLSQSPLSVDSKDIDNLRARGFDDNSILEAALSTALSCFLCTLSAGLSPWPDSAPRALRSRTIDPIAVAPQKTVMPHAAHTVHKGGPYIRTVYQSPTTFAPFAQLQKTIGFIPNFFRAQTLWPELIETEADSVGKILFSEGVLTRVQKECIFLAVSAVRLNSYCVAAHCNLMRGLGISPEEGDQVAVDHHQANLSEADKTLVDFAIKLGVRASEISRKDIERLRTLSFTDTEILECIAVTALGVFVDTLQAGLGIVPDFEPPPAFEQKKMHLSSAAARHTEDRSVSRQPAMAVEDPDAGLVAMAQSGDLEAFEDLIRRHSRRVYRALVAILGDPEEAKDAMQDAFLSAFKHIAGFQGRSKFSTWLVSIARNAALERLRSRKEFESLDEKAFDGDEEFRPRRVRAWQDNPEEIHSESERRQLVERAIMELPAKYRIVVMLRDIEQLSTDEVARQLGLAVPALKTRLLRGRLMLRESLSPHFAAGSGKAAV